MKAKPKTLAMVLAGGRVDELSALTYLRPKSALPFGGFARIIDFSLSNLMHSGLHRVGILSQYRNFSLINHIGIGAAWDMIGRFRGVSILPPFQASENEHWYRGSADAVYQNLDFIRFHDPENVLILSGDHVYHMDYREIIEFHKTKNADLTIAFVQVPQQKAANRFGIAEIDDEETMGGRILSYEEKPPFPKGDWASMTIYCFRPQVLYDVLKTNIEEDGTHEFGRDIIPRLMHANRRVYGYKFNGYWGYTRTVEEYLQTSMDLLGENPKISLKNWGIRTNLEHRRILDCAPMKLGSDAVINNSLVYNGCTIEGTVENSILFPRVRIGRGSTVRDSILFFNNKLGEDCRFDKVISDVNNTFGNGCLAGGPDAGSATTVIGMNNSIEPGTPIEPGCILYPEMPPGDLLTKINACMEM